MTTHHDYHAEHAKRAGRDGDPGQTRPVLPRRAPDPAGNRSRSQTHPTASPAVPAFPADSHERFWWLRSLVTRLRRWRAVPDELLRDLVTGRGRCMRPDTLTARSLRDPAQQDSGPGQGLGSDGGPGSWWDDDPEPGVADAPSDYALALRLCAGCPVAEACTEWELRLHGPDTVGVWGGMSEQDRRDLYPMWLRDNANTPDAGNLPPRDTGAVTSDDPTGDDPTGDAGAAGGDR